LAIVTAGWVPLTSNTLLQRIRQHQHLRDLQKQIATASCLFAETERIAYEVRGRVSSGELLQLVIEHEQFAWLHRISELVVQIDEMLHEPVSLDNVKIWLPMPALIAPSEVGNAFARKYNALSMNLTLSWHAEVSKLLASISKAK